MLKEFKEPTELINSTSFKMLSVKTQQSYIHHYNRLMTFTNNKSILDFKDELHELINILKEQDVPPSSKNSMLNVISLLFNTKRFPIQSLTDYRDQLDKEHYIKKKETNLLLKEVLPSINELNNYTNELYSNQQYREYIINFLMINYGVRNMDVDLIITDNKKDINDIDNFLLITKKYISFIVNRYKTRDTYGAKKFKLETVPLQTAVKNLYKMCEKDTVCKLIINKDGTEVVDKNKYILHRTYGKIGEGKLFKSVISDYIKQGKIEKTKSYGMTRGTDISVILKDYYIE